MIKYRVISDLEKESKSAPSKYEQKTNYPRTEEYYNEQVAKAIADGYIVGAKCVLIHSKHKVVEITGVVPFDKTYGTTKLFFLSVSAPGSMLYNPDELQLIEEDPECGI